MKLSNTLDWPLVYLIAIPSKQLVHNLKYLPFHSIIILYFVSFFYNITGRTCAARVVSLRELVARDEAVDTRHEQRRTRSELHIIIMWTCFSSITVNFFEMSSKKLDWMVMLVNIKNN